MRNSVVVFGDRFLSYQLGEDLLRRRGSGCYVLAHKNPIRKDMWVPDYVGEAECVYERFANGHERLAAAVSFGATHLFVSEWFGDKTYRVSYETLMRRELQPRANLQPIPSLEAAADAARCIGRQDMAEEYTKKLVFERLIKLIINEKTGSIPPPFSVSRAIEMFRT